MTICPYCSHENIEGADVCEACEQPLTDQHLHEPATAVERGLLKDHIHVIKAKPPITVAPDTPVGDVLRLLVEKGIGCVIVAKDGEVSGIFSERDALLKIGAEASSLAGDPVSKYMTKKVESLEDTAKIAFAVQRMDLGSYRHIPIVDDNGATTGIISARDILRYLTERMTTADS